MEQEIEERLQMKYKNLTIEVEFDSFRKYAIIVKMEYLGKVYESKIIYKYDNYYTLDANISIIEQIIDKNVILEFFKKGVLYND